MNKFLDKYKGKIINLVIETIFLIIAIEFFKWCNGQYEIHGSYESYGNLVLLFIFIAVYYLVPAKLNMIVFFFGTAGYYLYLLSQTIYNVAFGQYYSFGLVFSLGYELQNSMDSVQEFILEEYYYPLIFLLVITIIGLFIYFKLAKKSFLYFYRFVIVVACGYLAYQSFNDFNVKLDEDRHKYDAFVIYKSDYYTYHSFPSSSQFVNTFSLSNYFIRDVINLNTTNAITDDDINEITEYLNSRGTHQDNEMTGIFEGKSLIIIQAESLMNVGIDETLTPTLYKLMTEGIYFENFNAPALPGSTSDTEYMVNTSIIPLSDDYVATFKYINNELPVTLPKIFAEYGYSGYGFHNNYGEFYSRDIMFPNYGYKFFDCTDLGLESLVSDSVVFDLLQWILIEKEQFLGYFVTFNGHQPYDFELNEEIVPYISLVQKKYPDLSDEYVSYFAKNMDLDRALEKFITNLKYTRDEDVVIMVFGDHYAKGLLEVIDGAVDATGYSGNNPGNTPLIIWSPTLDEPIVESKYANSLDILPTLCNMWNMEYDYNKILGYDIFDDEYDGFVFNASETYRTGSFYYNFNNGYYEVYKGTEEEAEKQIADIVTRMRVSKNLLEIDYFSLIK